MISTFKILTNYCKIDDYFIIDFQRTNGQRERFGTSGFLVLKIKRFKKNIYFFFFSSKRVSLKGEKDCTD